MTFPRFIPGKGERIPEVCTDCGNDLDGTYHETEEWTDVDRTRGTPCKGCSSIDHDEDGYHASGTKSWACCVQCGEECKAGRAYQVNENGEYVCGDACMRREGGE